MRPEIIFDATTTGGDNSSKLRSEYVDLCQRLEEENEALLCANDPLLTRVFSAYLRIDIEEARRVVTQHEALYSGFGNLLRPFRPIIERVIQRNDVFVKYNCAKRVLEQE